MGVSDGQRRRIGKRIVYNTSHKRVEGASPTISRYTVAPPCVSLSVVSLVLD